MREMWWVFLFILLCYTSYQWTAANMELQITHLNKEIEMIESSISSLIPEKEQLQEEIQSQTDSKWVELVLMKELGLVPEGQEKVHFIH
jgi:hypothetical protein